MNPVTREMLEASVIVAAPRANDPVRAATNP